MLAAGGWSTNAEMFADLSEFGWLEGRVLDMTYGMGCFWQHARPGGLVGNDLDVGKGDWHVDWTGDTPEEWVGAFDAVVFDPPYRLSGARDLGEFDGRYGTQKAYTVNDVGELYALGCEFAARCVAPGGRVMVKHQPQIAGGRFRDFRPVIAGGLLPLRLLSELVLVTQPRPQPEGRRQVNPRNNVSYLAVFGGR